MFSHIYQIRIYGQKLATCFLKLPPFIHVSYSKEKRKSLYLVFSTG